MGLIGKLPTHIDQINRAAPSAFHCFPTGPIRTKIFVDCLSAAITELAISASGEATSKRQAAMLKDAVEFQTKYDFDGLVQMTETFTEEVKDELVGMVNSAEAKCLKTSFPEWKTCIAKHKEIATSVKRSTGATDEVKTVIDAKV